MHVSREDCESRDGRESVVKAAGTTRGIVVVAKDGCESLCDARRVRGSMNGGSGRAGTRGLGT